MQQFIGRVEWLNQFAAYRAQEAGVIWRITGQPGIGKSSLLRQFMWNCEQDKAAHVMLDVEHFTPAHGADVLKALADSARFFDTEKTNKSTKEKLGELYGAASNGLVSILEFGKDALPYGGAIATTAKILTDFGKAPAEKAAQQTEQALANHPELFLLNALAATATPERKPICFIDSYEHLLNKKLQIKTRLLFGWDNVQDTAERSMLLTEWLGHIWHYLHSKGWRVVLLGREVPLAKPDQQMQRFNAEEVLAAARLRHPLAMYMIYESEREALLTLLNQLSFGGNPLWLQVGMNLLEDLLQEGKDLIELAARPEELQACFEEEDPLDTDSYEGIAYARCKLVLMKTLTQHIADLDGQAWKIALPRILNKGLIQHLFPPEQANAIVHSYKLAGVFRQVGEQFTLHEEIRDLLLAYARSKGLLDSEEARATHAHLWEGINQQWKVPEVLKDYLPLESENYHTIDDPPCTAITAELRPWILEACYHQCLAVVSLRQHGFKPQTFAEQLVGAFRLSLVGKYQVATRLSTADSLVLANLHEQLAASQQAAIRMLGSTPATLERLHKALAYGLIIDPRRDVDYWKNEVKRFGDLGAYLGLESALDETAGDPKERLAALDALLQQYGDSEELEAQIQCAKTWISKGVIYYEQGELDKANVCCQEIIQRYGYNLVPEVQTLCAQALFNQGVILGEQGHQADAIACYQELTQRYGESSLPEVQTQCAQALFNQGFTLAQQGHEADAIAYYQELTQRYGESSVPELQTLCVQALFNQGFTLAQQGHKADALACYQELTQRYGESSVPEVQIKCAQALLAQGFTLAQQGHEADAIACYQELTQRYGESSVPELQTLCAQALFYQGFTLAQQGHKADAIACYQELTQRYGESSIPDVQTVCAKALFSQGSILVEQGHMVEALDCYQDLIRRYGDSLIPEVQAECAQTLAYRWSILVEQGHMVEALDCYQDLIRRYGDSLIPEVQMLCARALIYRGSILVEQGHMAEALDCYQDLIRRYDDSLIPEVQMLCARALAYRGSILAEQGHMVEALDCYQDVLCRYGDSLVPEVQTLCVKVMISQVVTLSREGHIVEALNCYQELVQRYGDILPPEVQALYAQLLDFLG
jgi:TolA-binding protein